eukprot:Nk52_evm20s745 gene=Nk52_evmTU20s745
MKEKDRPPERGGGKRTGSPASLSRGSPKDCVTPTKSERGKKDKQKARKSVGFEDDISLPAPMSQVNRFKELHGERDGKLKKAGSLVDLSSKKILNVQYEKEVYHYPSMPNLLLPYTDDSSFLSDETKLKMGIEDLSRRKQYVVRQNSLHFNASEWKQKRRKSHFVDFFDSLQLTKKGRKTRRETVMEIMGSPYVVAWYGILTIYALIMEDVNIAFLDMTYDKGVSISYSIVFLFFLLENVIFMTCKPDYTPSMYMLFDLLATVSIIPTTSFFFDAWKNYPLYHLLIGRATRGGAKLIRFVKTMRFMQMVSFKRMMEATKINSFWKVDNVSANEKQSIRISDIVCQRIMFTVLLIVVGTSFWVDWDGYHRETGGINGMKELSVHYGEADYSGVLSQFYSDNPHTYYLVVNSTVECSCCDSGKLCPYIPAGLDCNGFVPGSSIRELDTHLYAYANSSVYISEAEANSDQAKRDLAFTWYSIAVFILISFILSGDIFYLVDKPWDNLMKSKKLTTKLYEIFKVVLLEDSYDVGVDMICDSAHELLETELVELYFVDHMRQQIWRKEAGSTNGVRRIPIYFGLIGRCAHSGQTINIPDMRKAPYSDYKSALDSETGCDTRSLLLMSVRNMTSQVVAVVLAANKKEPLIGHCKAFNEDDEHLLKTFCSQLSVIIEKRALEAAFEDINSSGKPGTAYLSEFIDRKRKRGGSYVRGNDNIPNNEMLGKINSSKNKLHGKFKSTLFASVPEYHKSINTWDIDVLALPKETIFKYSAFIFNELGLNNEFGIEESTLYSFLVKVDAGYNSPPYHNFHHGFSVLHGCYMLLKSGCMHKLDFLDILALYIASLTHDIGHDGVNNNYHIVSQSPLAIQYNDISVLENFHASQCFKILSEEDSDILKNLDSKSRADVKKTIITAILSTDMAKHFDFMIQLQRISSFENFEKEDSQTLVDTLVHSADLANPCFEPQYSRQWAVLVSQEFQNQYKLEQERGLEPTEFMNVKDELELAKMNINFIDYIVNPLWTKLAELLPSISDRVQRMEENRACWVSIKETWERKLQVDKIYDGDETEEDNANDCEVDTGDVCITLNEEI